MGEFSMVIEVRLYATLRRHAPVISHGVFPVQVPADYTVGDLLKNINVDSAEVHIIMINGVSAALDSTLHSGDRLGLFPPVGGG